MKKLLIALMLVTSACTYSGYDAASPVNPVPIWWVANLQDSGGELHGKIKLAAGRDTIIVKGTVTGLSPGQYGVHMHSIGRCDAPDFKSAGGHWNPTMRQHGSDNPNGAHAGDLGNLTVEEAGVGVVDMEIADQHILGSGGLVDDDGAAIIVHAGPDDNLTDPSGNSGARMLCGIVGRGD